MADFEIKKVIDDGVKAVKKRPALAIAGVGVVAVGLFFLFRGRGSDPMIPGYMDYGYPDGDPYEGAGGLTEDELKNILAGWDAENTERMTDFQYQMSEYLQSTFNSWQDKGWGNLPDPQIREELPTQTPRIQSAAPGSLEWQIDNIVSTPSIRSSDHAFTDSQIKTISDWATQEKMAVESQKATGLGTPGGTSKIIRDPSLVQVFHADGTVSFKPYEAKKAAPAQQKTATQAQSDFKQAQAANNQAGMIQALKDYNIATGTAPAGGY